MGRWIPPAKIRPIAIAVVRVCERLLVMEVHDLDAGRTFYRPLGGGIEFGERGDVAVAREFREELGIELANVRYLGMLENLYELHGRAGHELVLVYDAELADRTLHTKKTFEITEGAGVAKWIPIADFEASVARLVPEGLLALIRSTLG